MKTIYFAIFLFLINVGHVSGQFYPDAATGDTAHYPYWIQMMQDPDANFHSTQRAFEKFWAGREDYKGNGWKVFKRWEYINKDLVQPNGKLPKPGYFAEQYQEWLGDHAVLSPAGSWQQVGPVTTPSVAAGGIVGLGRINDIAFDPIQANTIYVGSPSGGLWKTVDGGLSWTVLTSNLPTLGVSSIIIPPSNPGRIIIGTGDRDAADAPGMGVYMSNDNGVTWNPSNTGMGNQTVGMMIMHPSNASVMLAATSSGIFKSIDGGNTWSRKSSNTLNYKDIKFNPGDPTIVYGTENGKFYRSNNTGETWTQITSGIITGSRMVIGVSPDEPNWVYLCQTNGPFSGLLKSTDSGLTFITQSTAPNLMEWSCDGSGTTSQAHYDLCIAVDPSNANIIYIGGINIWKSTNGGASDSWSIVAHWSDQSCAPRVHADHHVLTWSSLNGNLYNGNDGGIYYTSNNGINWNDISSGLAITQIYKIGQSPTNQSLVMSGTQDNGTSVSNGTAFTYEMSGDGMECVIDNTNTSYRYGEVYYGSIFRTTGSGYYSIYHPTWSECGNWVTPFLLHATNPNIMFVGLVNLWRVPNVKATDPATITWNNITSGEINTFTVLEQSKSNTEILYAVKPGLIKRTDNATSATVTWVVCALPGGLTPTDLATHPTDQNIVYATAGSKVFKSSNKGMTWIDISGNLPLININCIVFDKNSNEGIYIGTKTGVFYKDATMSDWITFNSGLPMVDVRELEIYYGSSFSECKIKAATYGRGLWSSDLIEAGILNPSNVMAVPASLSEIDLTWNINSNNNNVLLSYNTSPTFGTPANGSTYLQGSTIPGGGIVIYNGSNSMVNHCSLSANTAYYYKIWSYDTNNQYSAGVTVSTATMAGSAIVSTSFPAGITALSANSGGNVISGGGMAVTARGICWGTSVNPAITGSHTNDGSGTGLFSSSLSGLTANTKYHIRAYATTANGTYYGNDILFTSEVCAGISSFPWCEGFENGGSLPGCWSQELTIGAKVWTFQSGGRYNRAPLSAHNGDFNAYFCDGVSGSNFVVKLVSPELDLSSLSSPKLRFWHAQFCQNTSMWSCSQDELRIYYKTSLNGTWILLTAFTNTLAGWFQEELSLPNSGSTYYLAFEATSNNGYGVCIDDIQIQESSYPVVVTTIATDITSTSLLSGGFVTSIGGSLVSSRGVCWGTTINPTLAGNHTVDGSGYGEFTSSVTGLLPNTTYHIRAYATNSFGTSYGTDLFYRTACDGSITSFPWAEGFENGGVMPSCWVQEQVNNSVAKWSFKTGNGYYVPFSAHSGTYNACYRDPAMVGSICRLITPRLSLDLLTNPQLRFWYFQQMNNSYQDSLKVYYKTSLAGNWIPLATYTANMTTWTQEIIALPNASNDYYIAFEGYAKAGYGVCVDDVQILETVFTNPLISSTNVSNVTVNTASTGGTITYNGGLTVTARGVCWSTTSNPTIANDKTTDGSGSGSFISSITGLSPGVTYHVRAYATNGIGTSYGADIQFSTSCITTVSTFPWVEGFENNGVIPVCWTQEQVNNSGISWIFTTGGVYSNPPAAHSGTYNACLKDQSGARNITRLISPRLSLDLLPNPQLRFWHTQKLYSNQDSLSVYYKTSLGENWIPLATYTANIMTWTREIIALPDASSDYYIAFEGNAKYGYGVCIDDVAVYSCSSYPDASVTINASQSSGTSATITLVANVLNGGTMPVYQWKVNGIVKGTNSGTFTFTPANNDSVVCVVTSNSFCVTNSIAVSNQVKLVVACNSDSAITINHFVSGSVAPVNKTVTYGVVSNIPGELTKCWITSNLGADHLATNVADATEGSAGWYWQFNRKQGYKHDGTNRTPNTAWATSINENSDWLPINDPCTIELGNGWRIPTSTEWSNVDASGSWIDWNGPWNSAIKMHAAGKLNWAGGTLYSRGSEGGNWSGSQYSSNFKVGLYFAFANTYCFNAYSTPEGKAMGLSVRCLKNPVITTTTTVPCDTILETVCYNATNTIIVGGNGNSFVVQNGGAATMVAGQNIKYMVGTTVQSGGYMLGYISPTNPYCFTPAVQAVIDSEAESRKILDQSWFKIYPNPTTGNFILELSEESCSRILVEIYTMRGEKVLAEAMNGEKKHEFSLLGRQVGLYLIRVVNGNRAETTKIIKY